MPVVSVVMPVFNGERFVAEALESLLGQTLRDIEIIAVDDGSTDATPAILAGYAAQDERLRVITNPTNLRQSYSRNAGVAEARSPLVAMMDADDLALPERLAAQKAFMDANPAVALSGCFSQRMEEDGSLSSKRDIHHPTDPEEIRARLLFRSCISHRSVIARREVLERYPYSQDFPVSQDFDLFFRIAHEHPIANVPRVLMSARTHGDQISRSKRDLIKEMNMKITRRALAELGIEPSPADMDLHFALSRIRQLRTDVDETCVARADHWLARIRSANQVAGIYDRTALDKACGHMWFNVCRQAARRNGHGSWIAFARSTLLGPALSGAARGFWARKASARN